MEVEDHEALLRCPLAVRTQAPHCSSRIGARARHRPRRYRSLEGRDAAAKQSALQGADVGFRRRERPLRFLCHLRVPRRARQRDDISKTKVDRWDALRRQALGDGLAEAVIRRYVEQLGAPSERAAAVIRRQEAAIDAAIGALDAAPLQDERFDIGDVAMLAALAYLDFRSPEIAWRERFPRAALWLDRSSCRPSAIATAIARA